MIIRFWSGISCACATTLASSTLSVESWIHITSLEMPSQTKSSTSSSLSSPCLFSLAVLECRHWSTFRGIHDMWIKRVKYFSCFGPLAWFLLSFHQQSRHRFSVLCKIAIFQHLQSFMHHFDHTSHWRQVEVYATVPKKKISKPFSSFFTLQRIHVLTFVPEEGIYILSSKQFWSRRRCDFLGDF